MFLFKYLKHHEQFVKQNHSIDKPTYKIQFQVRQINATLAFQIATLQNCFGTVSPLIRKTTPVCSETIPPLIYELKQLSVFKAVYLLHSVSVVALRVS